MFDMMEGSGRCFNMGLDAFGLECGQDGLIQFRADFWRTQTLEALLQRLKFEAMHGRPDLWL